MTGIACAAALSLLLVCAPAFTFAVKLESQAAGQVQVVEYYNPTLDHYFITYVPAEIAKLDAGLTPTRWIRTGQWFQGYETAQAGLAEVCRYYIPPNLGDSHFFGRGRAECLQAGQNNPTFVLEEPVFMHMPLPALGVCTAGTRNVYRVFSQRVDANHRYLIDQALRDQMVAKGWLAEGDGPDLVVMCAPLPAPAKVFRVVVVPLRYQSPPSNDPEAIAAYTATLPRVTQQGAQATFAKIAAWWSAETYGLHALEVTVLPAVTALPGSPGCDHAAVRQAAMDAARGTQYDKLVAITPYACWQSHMVTIGSQVIAWNIYTDEPGKFAHELGHTFGLGHAASRLPTYVLYGSGVDQMGRGGASAGLTHFLADHKEMLGVLKPLPCESATLRSIYAYPDAIRCGSLIAEYLEDWREVWISKREFVSSPYGGSDTTHVAKLQAGQSYAADGKTFTHVANGQVTVR